MVASATTENWIIRLRPAVKPSLRLFCFPYAGGGASTFNAWANQFQSDVDLCAVQAPGRESRYSEEPFLSLAPMIDCLVEAIEPFCDLPFAFFGHCLGALTAFELARGLSTTQKEGLVHLFVSGCRAPQLPMSMAPIHLLPEQEFTAQLKKGNQIPDVVLEDPELLSLFMPVLRADFSVWETYVYSNGEPLDCPISAFCGSQEINLTPETLQLWSVQTRDSCIVRMLPGNHFFIHSSRTLFLRFIAEDLRRALRRKQSNSAA